MPTTLEFMVPKAETEAFNTAVYRFAELQGSLVTDELVLLKSEPFGPVERKSVTLWSDAAIGEFAIFWASFRKSLERPALVGRYVRRS